VDIGTVILLERRARGVRQEDLAHALGVSRTVISNWERGRAPLQPERAIEVMQALKSAGAGDVPRASKCECPT
jgi:transcriptional regulator with XRE-family HTH domain